MTVEMKRVVQPNRCATQCKIFLIDRPTMASAAVVVASSSNAASTNVSTTATAVEATLNTHSAYHAYDGADELETSVQGVDKGRGKIGAWVAGKGSKVEVGADSSSAAPPQPPNARPSRIPDLVDSGNQGDIDFVFR